MKEYWMFNKWDASDFEDNEYVALEDLKQDFDKDPYNLIPDKPNGDDVDAYNAVVFGWADNLNRNGLSYLNWYYAIGSEDPINNPANWPEDSVVQHELSHNFNASDQGYWWWEHPECIMNYWHAYHGTEIWCNSCFQKVKSNIMGQGD